LDYFWKIDQFNRFCETLNTLNSPKFPEDGPYMIEMNIHMNITHKSDPLITIAQVYIHTNIEFIGSCTVSVMHASDSVIPPKSISGHIKDMTLLTEILDTKHYTDTFMLHCKFEIFCKLVSNTIQMNLLPSSIKTVKSIENTIFGESEFNNKNGSSIKFIVGDEHYVVPKKLLCATDSSYFRNICLTYEEKEKDMTNELMSSELLLAFKQLLLFIITGSIEQHDYDMLKNLLTIADKYDVLHLKLICEHYLLRCITVENAIELIQLAFLLNAKFLRTHAAVFIKFHLKEIIDTKEFRGLLQEDLNKIMELFEKNKILEISTEFLANYSKR